MKNSLCWLAVAFGLLLTLNSARAVIDFDPAADQTTPTPQPPATPTPAPSLTTPAPTAPPADTPTPHASPTQAPTNSATPDHSDERRFYFFSKLKLSDDQKTKMGEIMTSDADWKEKRKRMLDILTLAQKMQLRTLVDGWKIKHPSGGSGSASTQE